MKKRILIFTLVALLGLNAAFSFPANVAAKTSADFEDLKALDAATKAKFDAMISAGIFDGVSDTTFGLKDEMNRAQFAKVAALITGIEVNKDLKTSSFSDVTADDAANGYALPFIEALKTAGITEGYGEGTYNPAGKVTKEQLATFLVRLLGKDAEAKAKTGDDSTVSDWAQGYVAEALSLKLLENLPDGIFGGKANATRDLLLTGAYEAKQQYVPIGKVSIVEAKQVGVKKINVTFNKAVDSTKAGLSVTKAEGAQIDWAADKRSATLIFAKNLEEGSYVITLSGLDAADIDKSTATVSVTAERVTKIEFLTTSDTLPSSSRVPIQFRAINQFGETVQDFLEFSLYLSVAAFTDSTSMTPTTFTVFADTSWSSTGEKFDIEVTDLVSGVTATRTYIVGDPEVVPQVVSTSKVVAKPTASVSSGAVTVGTSVSLINATQGATIYYTTDGTSPNTSSTVYSSQITITNAMTIKAIAVKSGMTNSSVMTVSYTIIEQAATPTANLAGGAVAAGTSVSLSNATQGATIYYTTDNSDPSPTNGTIYSSPITITNAMTIKAIAVKSGMTNSEVMSVSYTIAQAQVATPTAIQTDSNGSVQVELSTTTSDATIYYTTDGIHDPTTNPQTDPYTVMYNGPFYVQTGSTIKAIAVKTEMANSNIMTEQITVVPTLVLSANSLEYIGESNISGRSLLKLTFSKNVDPTSAADGNYIVLAQGGMNIQPVFLHSATWGGIDHENEVTLEVDSLAGIAPGTYVSVQVDNVKTTDLSETIGNGHNNTGYTVP
ncbi:chitobiase/beta-hexosaminidase C-terminal domain-containing protein [Paenibacillus endoradicis]|uniref:chitobiase/beta-hexosaminidase C-terminal domain-containing protein n=1 Tax=Paenibacillus endoradicis TaxID=2972487 RepID=UPI00215906F7|nr:chitobiase/beta-hexosaminidase C-terminal domain-containing protein [Paenibacillus endoradicis]MCR8657438.1 chitobiase/beta-hexosaminidase C-terminal domain-containing protein [Paenibacillus endoradicis]